MGGNLPLGYDRPIDAATRALVVNLTEAEQVRFAPRTIARSGGHAG